MRTCAPARSASTRLRRRCVSGVALATALCLLGVAPGSPAAAAPESTPSADVVEPTSVRIPLTGLDEKVLAEAPEPHAGHAEEFAAESTDEASVDATEEEAEQADEQPEHTEPANTESAHTESADTQPAIAADVSTADDPAALVAVTAGEPFAAGTSVQVRALEDAGWSDWQELGTGDGHGPDPDSDEAQSARYGSDPLTTSDATQVQVRVDTPDGTAPAGTELTVVHAPIATSDAEIDASTPSPDAESGVSAAAAAMPPIVTRAQWGANESWRDRSPSYNDTVKAGFLHHTASTSSYSPAGAAAQVRAIYAYHTKSLGHSDIDYNFVVDRFGRLYEGRAGGIDRAVLGAHTAGFNVDTFAVVALGNYETTAPVSTELAKVKDSLARLFAWKLGRYGVSPTGTARLLSAGFIRPTRYPRGTVAVIPTISSHQMVNYTSCPGKHLQATLPAIRSLAGKYASGGGPSGPVLSTPTPTYSSVAYGSKSATVTARTDRALTWRADIISPCSPTPVRAYTGRTKGAGPIRITWDLRSAGGERVLPAAYTVVVSGTAGAARPTPVAAQISITPVAGVASGPCANASRVTASSVSETSVKFGRLNYPGSRTVLITAPADESRTALAAGVVAAPLARRIKAPLLLNRGASLSAQIAADLKHRAASRVIIVGSTSVVPNSVAAAIRARGIAVSRLAGGTAADTAAIVARSFPASTPAVVVNPAEPAHSLGGSALAAARVNPVLLAGSSIPDVTKRALATRSSVAVAASTDLSSKAVRRGLAKGASWTRLTGSDEVAASVAIAKAAPSALGRALLLPSTPAAWGIAPAALTSGGVLLFTPRSTLSPAVSSTLRSRSALRLVLSPVVAGWLSDPVLGAASRLIGAAPARVTYRLSKTNASPEPVRAGGILTARVKVKVSDGQGGWKAVPAGRLLLLQFKASGSSAYRNQAVAKTGAGGKVVIRLRAKTTGTWRFVLGGAISRGDRVKVRG